MKGIVVQRWKPSEGGDKSCEHDWTDSKRNEQLCQKCLARRVRSEVWSWQHEYRSNGVRRFKTGTAKTKRAAQEAMTESLAAHAKGEAIEPSRITVAEFSRDWLTLVKPRLKAGTWRSYHDIVEQRLIPLIGGERLSQLRPAAIQRAYDELRTNGRRNGTGGLSETSIEHTHRTLHAALEHATRSRLIARNVANDIAKPKRRHAEMHTWNPENVGAFLEFTAEHRLHPLYVTAFDSAARRSELLGLRWTDIDLDAGTASIRRGRTAVAYEVVEDAPKSRKSIRVIDLEPRTVAILRRWQKTQLEERLAWGPAYTASGYVFTRENGEPVHPHHVAGAFNSAIKRSGLPRIRFHDLRHSWATIALRAGVSPKIVSERLGHASTGFTLDTYAHAVPGWGAEAAAAVGSLVFGTA